MNDQAAFEITDLHIWEIGPGYRAAIIAVRSSSPLTADEVRRRLPADLGLAHVTVEISRSRRAGA